MKKTSVVYKNIIIELSKNNDPPHLARYKELGKQIRIDFDKPIFLENGKISLNEYMDNFCKHIEEEELEKIRDALTGNDPNPRKRSKKSR